MRTTGFFIVGIVFVFQTISSAFVEAPESFSDLLWEPAFILHVTTALLGYSGMAISAVYGLLYLMLFYDIKKHHFGLIYKQLPSLEVMSSFTYRSATLGLVFLTIAMAGGLALLVRVYGTYWSWDPKLMITFVAWLIYGLCVAASRFWGWSAQAGCLYFDRGIRHHPLFTGRREPRLYPLSRVRLMDLIVVGMNHRSAPIDVRELVAFSEEEILDVLAHTHAEETLSEALLLSTCNRTEFYGLSTDNGAAEMYIRNLIVEKKHVDLESHPGYAYTLTRNESVRHLLRVAAGLDSLVLGESQILGQVRRAHELSLESHACGIVLNRIL